jgi:hypothetical protein
MSRDRTREFAERLAMAVSEPAELRIPESALSDQAPPKREGLDYPMRTAGPE